MREHAPVLMVVVPLFGAVLAALVRRPGPAFAVALACGFAVAALAIDLAVAVSAGGPISYRLGGWAPDVGIEYRVDALNVPILLLLGVTAAVATVYARRSVASELPVGRVAWFYALYLLCLTGLIGIALTNDAFNAFVFLEISSLATYAMIALGRDRRALVAAYQYLIIGTIGATFYVIGVGFLFLATGTLNLSLIAERLGEAEAARAVVTGLAFVLVGIAMKVALFPLHLWLPNAYAYAPSFATVFLGATATKVAVYLLFRYVFSVFGAAFVFEALPTGALLIALSLAAAFGASTVAIFQSDVKRLLAYSSVGQIGYATLGLALGNAAGLTGGLVHLLNHAMMKGAAFMAVGAVVFRLGTCRLEAFAGLGRAMPATMAALTVAGLGLIGVPGTAGFVSKWYLIKGALEAGMPWLALLIVASSILALLYVGRLVELIWLRPRPADAAPVAEAPLELLLPTLALAAATIWFGLDTRFTAGLAQAATVGLFGGAR
ncbi:monovalent cation/H+ antiporter subunit D family protein [Prosthecomicrobium pneumaticum]|uniref:Multicomponent Na+:H+ antiporter subunit D n=1 Tax=Prosthecomicrobium pneumaticum TaxID=81895 RepID=A0A7W9CTP0_9HYPH|nr:monovalent cation/H+ antiporter subunit D family protein [Prosthecomicrobium pneumaticum]MBB5751718.1 multicomponent Na+:H+ antiporter subunit D [Prosthecomicrobium pneumaticum]